MEAKSRGVYERSLCTFDGFATNLPLRVLKHLIIISKLFLMTELNYIVQRNQNTLQKKIISWRKTARFQLIDVKNAAISAKSINLFLCL